MIAKKSFGQHFLVDLSVIKKIVHAAEIVPHEVVVEVGPGRGVLTRALVQAGAKVIAIEADRDLIEPLREEFGDKIDLISADVLKTSLPKEVTSYKLVSNLPYNIASAVLEQFLSSPLPPSRSVVMVQKEVADRILAKPGEMSLLSVACQMYGKIRRVVQVRPGAFRPMPKVDSSVICIDRVAPPVGVDPEEVIQLAKVGFRSRRKQLHGNLAEGKIAPSDRTKTILKEMGLPETARAQELSITQWMDLWSRLRVSDIL